MLRPYRPSLSEKHIQKTCSDFLALDGWRRVRMDVKHLRGLGVQEPGMADDLYIRYWTGAINQVELAAPYESWAQVLWIEWKSAKGKAAAHQQHWHANERVAGALTWIAGEDFTASIDGFMGHYYNSGLCRKQCPRV